MPKRLRICGAERFDFAISDLFAAQSEITGRIAVELNLELVEAEAARPIEHPDARDYILRGRAELMRPRAGNNVATAVDWLERALALVPASVEAQSLLADALVSALLERRAASAAADIARAESLTGRALLAAPRNPLAHYAKGQVLRVQGRPEEAASEYEIAIAFNRNWVSAISHLGRCKLLAGAIEDSISLEKQAIRLSPRDPRIGLFYGRIGQARLLQLRLDEAIPWLERSQRINPHPTPHAFLAAAYALRGYAERSAAELAEARRLSNDGRYSTIAHLKATEYFGTSKVQRLYEAAFFAGLRKAGMPER
jgi:tetratricopeptide (TPR) repeat protein